MDAHVSMQAESICVEYWVMSWSGRPKVSDRQFAALLRSAYLHCRLLPIHKLRATTVVPLVMSYRLLRGRPSVRLIGATRKIDLLRVDQSDGNFHVGVEFLVNVAPLVDLQPPSRSRSQTLKSESDSTSLVSLAASFRVCWNSDPSQHGSESARRPSLTDAEDIIRQRTSSSSALLSAGSPKLRRQGV